LTNTPPTDREDQTPAPEFSEPEVIQLESPPEETLQHHVKVVAPQRKPVTTFVLIAITVVVFLAQMITRAVFDVDIPVNFGIKYNPLIDQGQYWRLFTAMLLHGDILHIGFNMYALYILGRGIEPFCGRTRFLLLYVTSGFVGTTASYLLTAAPSLGASTATFGLLAAYGVLGYRNQKVFGKQSRHIVRNVVQVALINLALGLSPGIDNWGHLGGALGGFVLAWFGGPKLSFEAKGLELHLKNDRKSIEFFTAWILVFGITATVAIMLNGKS
jgi:rhomboid protease GluP